MRQVDGFFFHMNSMRSWKLFPLNVLGIMCVCVRFVLYIKIQASIALLVMTTTHRCTEHRSHGEMMLPIHLSQKSRREAKKLVLFTCRCFYMLWLEWNSVCYVVENVWLCCEWRAHRLKTKVIRRLHSFQMYEFGFQKCLKLTLTFASLTAVFFFLLIFGRKKRWYQAGNTSKVECKAKGTIEKFFMYCAISTAFWRCRSKGTMHFSSCIHLLFILHFDS